MLINKSILITGGTGSFGKKFIKTILNNYKPEKVIVCTSSNDMGHIWLNLK